MDNKHKYRFKTREEFFEEFGSSWREVVPCAFVHNMDHLLGQDYPYDLPDKDIKRKDIRDVDGFSISMPMLIMKKSIPNYKPKKIDRTI